MTLFLNKVHTFVSDTVKNRQNNSIHQLSGWTNTKTPWVRFTSMASINGDASIRKNWILFSGQGIMGTKEKDGKQEQFLTLRRNTNSIYSDNRPMPGITSVSVNNKGSMGSTREATITFNCWSLDQLNTLEQLFMTPGISCLLEFGWSHTFNGNSVNYNLSDLAPMSDRKATEQILEYVKQSGGHYDGMQGPVSSFSWNLREDGGFDCTTTIVSMAAMFLQIDTHCKSKGISKKTINDDDSSGEVQEAVETNINATIVTTTRLIDKEDLLFNGKLSGWKFELNVTTEETSGMFNWNSDNQYYVTWEFFENVIINQNLFYNENGGKTTPMLNNVDTVINYNPYIVSADPSKFILPFNRLDESAIFISSGGWFGSPKMLPDDMVAKVENNKFHFNKILINLEYLKTAVDNTDSLIDLLNSILKDLSDMCGGYWDFSVVINEKTPDEINVTDIQTTTEEAIDPLIFQVGTKFSVVKSVTLNTEVTERIKSQIMLGVNRSSSDKNITASTGSESNAEYNFYGNKISDLANPPLAPQKTSTFNISSLEEYKAEGWDLNRYKSYIMKNVESVYSSNFSSAGKGVNNENVENLKQSLIKYVSEVVMSDGNTIDSDKTYTMIPLKLGLTIDGLSGMLFGNAVHINYLPDRYLTDAFFQISGVSHTIDTNGWTTQIDTVMRTNMTKIQGAGSGSIDTSGITNKRSFFS